MRILMTAIILVALALGGQIGWAQEVCPGVDMMPTIASLTQCVQHAWTLGHIENGGVANSLLSKLHAAQATAGRGDVNVAIHLLGAFIQEVTAQAGRHLDSIHAEHMIVHAEIIIAGLDG